MVETNSFGKKEDKSVKGIKSMLPDRICVFAPSELYALSSVTKSGTLPPDIYISSDNLDFESIKTMSNDKYDYIQIPIKTEGMPDSSVLRFPVIENSSSPYSSPGEIKTFLVIQDSRDSAKNRIINVVMMLSQPKYMTQAQLDSVDFFYGGHFNGALIYSDVNGKVQKVEMVINGEINRTGIVAKEYGPSDTVLVKVKIIDDVNSGSPAFSSESVVQCDEDEIEILREIVVTPRKEPWDNRKDWKSDEPDHPSSKREPHEVGLYVDQPSFPGGEGQAFEVSVRTVGRGTATGAGFYKVGQMVHCSASPMVYSETLVSEFVSWSGFMSSTEETVIFTINTVIAEYSLTATFHDYVPCETGDKRDPLLDMRILGTLGSGIEGGCFGKTRSNGTRMHRGMDFGCPIGTPVYATISGRVWGTTRGLPNGLDWPTYEKAWRNYGDTKLARITFNCGNRIFITGKIDGEEVTVAFFHLQNLFVKDGDKVTVGQMIAQSGNTGNASNQGSSGPHLHYQVQCAGKTSAGKDTTIYLNPEFYIHSQFDDDGVQTNPCNQDN